MDYPVLCGGTFFTLLLQARKQRRQYRTYIKGKNEEYSDSNMFFELLKIVKPDYIEQPKDSFKTATSKYKNCSQSKSAYIPLDESWVIDIFDKNIKEDYEKFLGTMVNFVEKFIASNEDTKIKLISSFLELIQQDKSIQSTDIFYVCSNGQALSKADMSDSHCEILELYLPSFLLGIWHFIVMNRSDNSIGKDTYNSWHEEQEKGSKAVRKYIGTIGENYKRPIAVITDTSESKSKDLAQDNLPLERIPDNCLEEKECSSSKSSPSELVSDKVEDTSLHTEAPVTLNKTVSEDINNEQEPLAPDVADKMSDNDIHEDASPTGGNVYQENPLPERMLDVFNQSYFDFAVDGFIDSNPTTDRIHDMNHFIGHIRKQDRMDCLDKNEEIYKSIFSFMDILQEYLRFLKRSTGNLDFFPDGYKPPSSDNKEFWRKSNRYREQLRSLYQPIEAEIKKQNDEKAEQRRTAGKEAWDKSIQKSPQ